MLQPPMFLADDHWFFLLDRIYCTLFSIRFYPWPSHTNIRLVLDFFLLVHPILSNRITTLVYTEISCIITTLTTEFSPNFNSGRKNTNRLIITVMHIHSSKYRMFLYCQTANQNNFSAFKALYPGPPLHCLSNANMWF